MFDPAHQTLWTAIIIMHGDYSNETGTCIEGLLQCFPLPAHMRAFMQVAISQQAELAVDKPHVQVQVGLRLAPHRSAPKHALRLYHVYNYQVRKRTAAGAQNNLK